MLDAFNCVDNNGFLKTVRSLVWDFGVLFFTLEIGMIHQLVVDLLGVRCRRNTRGRREFT